MAVVAHLGRGMKPLVDLVYPPRCPLCGSALADQGGLCADCWSAIDIPGEGGCDALASWPDLGQSVPVHAATFYNDASRRLVLDCKHGRRIALAGLRARLIAARLPAPASGATPLLVPVPLHRCHESRVMCVFPCHRVGFYQIEPESEYASLVKEQLEHRHPFRNRLNGARQIHSKSID